MSAYYSLVLGSICRSNHHRIAILALEQLRDDNAPLWRDLFLQQQAAFLEGAKAPDESFKDFKNHVLHVQDDDWGGAPQAAREWYRRTVRALSQKDWKQAAYCAGVMSHYLADPVQPFHTGQSEEEMAIHRAVEWSFSKAFKEIHLILEQDVGYPDLDVPKGDAWLEEMVREGAAAANTHYWTVIQHYDFAVGKKNPVGGLDQELKDIVAGLIGHASVLVARVLDRAFAEAEAIPPKVNLTLDALFAVIKAPVRSVLAGLENEKERALVEAQYEEFKRTGKVRQTLSEDDKVVRALHAEEVLLTPLASLDCEWPRETGTAHGEGAPARKTRKLKKAAGKKPAYDVERAHAAERARAEAMAAQEAEEGEDDELSEEIVDEKPYVDRVALARVTEFDDEEVETEEDLDDEVHASDLEDDVEVEDLDDEEAGEDEDAAVADAYLSAEPARGEPAERERTARLAPEDDIVDAPSIGPKTATRLEVIGVRTVADLLKVSPEDAARRIKASHINAQVIRNWQSQALLCCTIPDLSGTGAQLLVGAGVASLEDLAEAEAGYLMSAIAEFADSADGSRLLRGSDPPDETDIDDWIYAARSALEERDAA